MVCSSELWCIYSQLSAHLFSPSVVEQCICNRIQADEMVLEWVAYSTTRNGLKLTMDTLEQFEHEVIANVLDFLFFFFKASHDIINKYSFLKL